MTQVNVHEAKTHLSALLARVEKGEEIVIARNGRPIAELRAIEPKPRKRTFGQMKNWPRIPDEFFAPLTDEELEEMGL